MLVVRERSEQPCSAVFRRSPGGFAISGANRMIQLHNLCLAGGLTLGLHIPLSFGRRVSAWEI